MTSELLNMRWRMLDVSNLPQGKLGVRPDRLVGDPKQPTLQKSRRDLAC